ncbi:MAG: hypothetical protein A2144_00950 [Chloroflexi bacterium RBG_16_50_9]|nr:MAG: hypothetical protein A2144_00950 [Chloroflexi bacterium RBG_16_50_9]
MQLKKIFLIKLIHTIIFIFMSICLLYILYCAIARVYDWTLLTALGFIFIEGLALLLNHWRCPLTTLAEKHGAAHGAVTDLFLPAWLARHTFKVSTIILILEIIWLGIGYFSQT